MIIIHNLKTKNSKFYKTKKTLVRRSTGIVLYFATFVMYGLRENKWIVITVSFNLWQYHTSFMFSGKLHCMFLYK